MSLAPETAPLAVTAVATWDGRRAAREPHGDRETVAIGPELGAGRRSPQDHNLFGKRTLTCVHQVSVAVGEDVVRQSRQDPELLRRQLEETLTAGWRHARTVFKAS